MYRNPNTKASEQRNAIDLKFENNHCIRKNILSDASGLFKWKQFRYYIRLFVSVRIKFRVLNSTKTASARETSTILPGVLRFSACFELHNGKILGKSGNTCQDTN